MDSELLSSLFKLDLEKAEEQEIKLNIWKSMFHILLKPGLEDFEHYFISM